MRLAKVHRSIYILLLGFLGVSMVTSVFLANMAWVFLGINWMLEGRWREKWQMAKESRLLQAFVGLFLLMFVGMLWTADQATCRQCPQGCSVNLYNSSLCGVCRRPCALAHHAGTAPS